MGLEEPDVDDLLCKELPEFAPAVREHRAEWPDQPMLYSLLGSLFRFVVSEAEATHGRPCDVAYRAYRVVENVLESGNESLRDCFVIEMLEPIANDSDNTFYPNFEPLMGPLSTREVRDIREWSKRQSALDAVLRHVREKLGAEVFVAAAQDAVDARAIVDVARWKQLRNEDKEWAYRTFAESWNRISSAERPAFTITGTARYRLRDPSISGHFWMCQ